jgi:hypothetical protein
MQETELRINRFNQELFKFKLYIHFLRTKLKLDVEIIYTAHIRDFPPFF